MTRTEFIGTLTDGCAAHINGLNLIHPWPDAADFAFVLTHDVETEEGLKRIPVVAAIEEELGFRSSWNLVPHKYKSTWDW